MKKKNRKDYLKDVLEKRPALAGFTLVEILIVLAILGGLAAIGVQKLNRAENLKTAVRRITTIIKKSRIYAKLNNQTYRLVINIEKDKTHQYWVESSSKTLVLDPEKERETKKEEKKADAESGPTDGFGKASDITKKVRDLPPGWYFTEIESAGQKQGTDEGLHYIYFLPQGVAEESVIQITDRKKSTWTLYIPPLTTQTQIFTEAKKLKDLQE
jgi:prepilin-type N-terminal cleavage/methylation domain-containing protein